MWGLNLGLLSLPGGTKTGKKKGGLGRGEGGKPLRAGRPPKKRILSGFFPPTPKNFLGWGGTKGNVLGNKKKTSKKGKNII